MSIWKQNGKNTETWRGKEYIKMDFKETGFDNVNRTQMAQNELDGTVYICNSKL